MKETTENKKKGSSLAIECIKVKRLFGSYDYELRPSAEAIDPNRLLLFYGDNGSGKTTVLTTLFHLLAPEDKAGHKSTVAETAFQKFEVEFASGDRVWAERPANKTSGGFVLGVQRLKKPAVRQELLWVESEKKVKPSDEQGFEKVLHELRSLNLRLFFLSDDRTVQLAGQGPWDKSILRSEVFDRDISVALENVYRAYPQVTVEPRTLLQHVFTESIKRAEMWVQSQAVRASSQGDSNVNALYGDMLKRILNSPLEGSPSPDTIQQIEKHVSLLEERSRHYAQYGLVPEFTGRDILPVLRSAPLTHLGIVKNVVTPYLESVEKRLDAIKRLQSQVDALVSTVNSFFTRKTITFDLHDGFNIAADDGRPLNPTSLSSGERHLLLLFCNTLLTLDDQSIFIIDEPEISLNIKWQRRLLESLLHIAGDNRVQFLVATHSFELLARHQWNTITLSETDPR